MSLAAVRSLQRLGDPAAVLPLYELVQNETADSSARQAAAEVLVTAGLLRRPRVGASRIFLWMLGSTLAIVSAAAASSIGLGAIAVFGAGMAVLIAYHHRTTRRERESGSYIGPDGATIHLPA